jgi:hypothetical protein
MSSLTFLVVATGLQIVSASRVEVYSPSPQIPVVAAGGAGGPSWLCLDRSGGLSMNTTSTVLQPGHLAWGARPPLQGSPVDPIGPGQTSVADWFWLTYGEHEGDYLAWHQSSFWGTTVAVSDVASAVEVVCEKMPEDPTGPGSRKILWAGRGDLNLDGRVTTDDILWFVTTPYDYNQSGAVDVQDFKSVQDAVNQSTVVGIHQHPVWVRYLALLNARFAGESR